MSAVNNSLAYAERLSFAFIASICLAAILVKGQGVGSNEDELRKHFEAARQAQIAGDLTTAIREYQAAIHIRHDIAEVYSNLGLVYHMSGQYADSAEAFRKAIALKPELPGGDFFLGVDYVRLSQPARAIPYLKKAHQQDAGNKEASSWLGTALWDAGETAPALAQLRETARAFPKDCEVLYLLGQAYQKAGNQTVQEVLASSLDKPIYHQIYGDIYLDQRTWDKAEGHYQRALQEDANWHGAHLGLGQVFLEQQKLDDAKLEFEQEARLDSRSATPRAKIGQIAILKGDKNQAIQNLTEAIRLSPESAADALGMPPMPTLPSDAAPDPKARAEYEAFVAARDDLPEDPARHLALAFVYLQLESASQSLQEWRSFTGSVKQTASADRVNRAAVLLAQHDFENASRELESVVAANPQNTSSRYRLARAYEALSTQVIAQMLAADPDFYRVHELLAKAYENRNEDEKALAEFKVVERMHPALPGLHFEIGHILWTMQDSEAALGELREELRVNPDHPEANAELGTILVSKHEFTQAIPALQKALLRKPDLIAAREQLGLAYFQSNELQMAERELRKTLSSDTEGNAHYLLGMVYRKLGRTQESTAALEQSRKIRAARLASVNLEKDTASP